MPLIMRDPSDVRKYWKVIGIDQPLAPLIETDNPSVVILKVPAHKAWKSVGERRNVPTEYQVYEILRRNNPDGFTVNLLASFSPRPKK